MKNNICQDQVFWYLKKSYCKPLDRSASADVVVIGGGMAGLSAAHAFALKNKKVILLEAFYCGAGASGKSSGFITPNSELSLTSFENNYGKKGGAAIWARIESGAAYIADTIKRYNLNCGYVDQPTLVVANSRSASKKLYAEHKNLKQLGYSTEFFPQETLSKVLLSKQYYGGVTYEKSFGINAYEYCQQMKDVLISLGVQIYEESPVLSFAKNSVTTKNALLKADLIVVCTDRFTPNFGVLRKQIYQVQTFLLISQVLSESVIKQIFPERSYMVWDTDLVYTYFRLTTDNRLLLGGGSLLTTYWGKELHSNRYMYDKLTRYFYKKFPTLDIQFQQMWPGLIGISKDISPLLGYDKTDSSIYYVAACAGLPIAAALGNYSADHTLDGAVDLQDYFCPYRSFPIDSFAQTFLGKRISFALSNLYVEKFL